MANSRNYKKTQQEKIEQERAMQAKLEREEKVKHTAMTVFVIILCVVLVIAFCFPALTWMIG